MITERRRTMEFMRRNLHIAVAYWCICAGVMVLCYQLSLPLSVGNLLSVITHVALFAVIIAANPQVFSRVRSGIAKACLRGVFALGMCLAMFVPLYICGAAVVLLLGIA